MTESLTSAEESTCLAPRLLARMHGDTGDDDDATPTAMPSKLAIISADFSQTSTAQRNPLSFSTYLNPFIVSPLQPQFRQVNLFFAPTYRFFPSPEYYYQLPTNATPL